MNLPLTTRFDACITGWGHGKYICFLTAAYSAPMGLSLQLRRDSNYLRLRPTIYPINAPIPKIPTSLGAMAASIWDLC